MNQGLIPAKWAALTPNGQAVYDVPNDRRVSWRDFDAMVRRLANGLRGLGLQPGDRVAMLSRNCVEYQALYFAAGRAGLVTQPLNWRLAVPELASIVRDAAPKAVISASEWSGVVEQLQREADVPNWLQFGDDSDGSLDRLIASSSDDEPEWSSKVADDDPFFILYTGGTTGQSKGALHTHRSAAAGMLNQTVAERIVPSDVYMLTGQMYHIPIVLAMNYMKHGCPLVLVNFEAKQALEIIEAERVSAFLGITTMLNWMMAVPGFENYDISSLRNIQYGGGPMPSSIVRQALEMFPCTLIQGYGQTEGTTMCFLSQEDHANAVAGIHPERLRSCGREGFITTVRVVDPSGNEVPRDGKTPGEIVVRSEANMIGYWNRPDLTAQTLRDGWMWTGDVATWDEDRYVFIVDRAKDMIISGGENIYSVQVEEAIARHPAVLECAVIGVPDEEWGESVKAVVVLKPGMQATEQEIIDQARKHLASYQKPRSVDFVAELPKAPTGKILKRELRAPYWADRERNV
ncbi:acyl-CoA synthetase [Microbispora rosea subsp. aerata]|nr:AMP-binding protein [Microbispora rosea]GGO20508.1 acyl-CoA synthetase [Microbispora rosea subsp. aerata]GIH57146.1 acyl-CoA synthetase [Microbispora rosea subsp. aerata]GLJ84784.1 acyl-CoA synthetase [Microbispora rosea subsp. aerata]